MMLIDIHGLAEWEPAAKGALELDAAKLAAIYQEKDAALAEVAALAATIEQATTDLPEPGVSQLRDTFDLWVWYVRGFRACARACFAARYHQDHADAASRNAAAQEIAALEAYRQALQARLDGTRYAYLIYWLLDTARLKTLVDDLRLTAPDANAISA
jgi:multidrug resistance efflux pump